MIFLLLKNLFKEKLTLLLSVGGIACSFMLMVVLKSILIGTVYTAGNFSREMNADIFVSQEGITNMIAGSSTLSKGLERKLLSIDNVKSVSPIYGMLYSFEVNKVNIAALLIGFDKENPCGKPWKLKEGRSHLNDHEVIIDETIATLSGVKIDDKIELGGEDYKIVGISKETNTLGSLYTFVRSEDAKEIMLASNSVNYYLVQVEDYNSVDNTAEKIEKKLKNVTATPKEKFAANNEQCLYEILSAPMNIMVYIGVIIAIIICGMTMYTFTSNKMQEYVLLKSLGSRNIMIIMAILVQTVSINFLGFTLGTVSAMFVGKIVNFMGLALTSKLEVNTILSSLFWVIAISVVSIISPIKKITKIDPASVFK